MINKAILNKIRKCLALANSGNENEAAAALAKARELMEQHGIDDEMLAMAGVGESSARGSRNLVPPAWESALSHAVCHALTVTSFIAADHTRRFVGREPRPEIAAYAFNVLFRQLKAVRANYIKTSLKRCKLSRKRQRADMFCEGWAFAVLAKVRELMPAPVEDAGVQLYLANAYPALGSISPRAAKMTRAANDYWNGVSQGKDVNLNVAVRSSHQPQGLLT